MIHALQEFAGLPWAMMPVRLAALAEGLVRLVVDQRGLGGEAFTTRSVVVPDAPGLEVRGGREAGGDALPTFGGEARTREAGGDARPTVVGAAAAGTGGASRHGIAQRQGGLAVISVGGVILGSDPWWARFDPMGFTNTGTLAATLGELRADPSVRGVLLQVDSPGGSVAGVAEAHSAVSDLVAAGKPVHVHAGNLMASAAYWIASAASAITVGRSASVGSIGVYTVVYDYSANLAKYGITAHLVKAGRDKGAGQGDVPVTAEQLAVIQREIDGIYSVFTADVGKARKMTAQDVAASATGEVFVGGEAVKRKLADRVADAPALRAELAARFGAAGRAGIVDLVEGQTGKGRDANKPPRAVAKNVVENRSKDMDTKILAAIVAGLGTIAAPRGHEGVSGGAFGRTLHSPDGDDGAGGGMAGGDARPTGGGAAGTIDAEAIAQGVLAKIGPGINKLVTDAVNAAAPRAVGDAVAATNKARAEREKAIRAAGAGFAHLEGVREAVDAAVATEGLSVEGAQQKIIEAAANGLTPVGGGVVSVGAEGKDKRLAAIGLSLMERVMGSSKLDAIANGGDKTIEAVNKLGFATHADLRAARAEAGRSDMSHMSLRRAVAVASHDRTIHHSENADRIMASLGNHTTSDFPNLLAGVINKSVLATMTLIPTTFEQWCSIGSAQDFRTQNIVEIGPGGDLRELTPGATIENGTIDDRGTTARVRTFGRKISITREMIVNDDVDAVNRIIQNWASTARLLPEILAMNLLKRGAATAFPGTGFNFLSATGSSGHGNLATGTLLTMDSLDALFTRLRSMKWTAGSNNRYPSLNSADLFMQDIGLVLGGESLRSKLATLQRAQNDPDNATTKVNIVQGQFEFRTSKLLDTKTDGSASNQFYVVASPSGGRAPIRVTFLNGRREPIFNPVNIGSILGQEIEVIYDANADYETPEAVVANPGTL